jgi:hypothetical protein
MLKSTIALYNNAILSELLARYDVQFEDVRFVGGFDSYVYGLPEKIYRIF